MLLHVFGHVDAHHGLIVVEHELGERFRQFGLADAGGPEEDEAADGPVGIAQPGAVTADGVGNQRNSFILPDHALVQPRFHVDELLHFAFEHARNRDAGPLGDDLGDVFFVDLFFEERGAGFDGFKVAVGGFDVALDFGQLAVFDLGGFLPVAGARGAFFIGAGLLQFFLELLDARDGALLAVPAFFETSRLAAQTLELVFDVAQTVFRCGVLLAIQRLALDFEMRNTPLEVVDFDRHAADLDRSAAPASSTRSMALSGRKRSVM